MAEKTSIAWTDHTFNMIIGCQKVSAACKHCYAEISSPVNVSRSIGLELWGPPATSSRRSASEAMWKDLGKWNRMHTQEKPGLVFCCSLSDVFEDYPNQIVDHKGNPMYLDDAFNFTTDIYPGKELFMSDCRFRLFRTAEKYTNLIFQLLTKRPENITRMVPNHWMHDQWPKNVWIGTTVENQETAAQRIPHLLKCPVPVRFLSCEPMLGQINLDTIEVGGAILDVINGKKLVNGVMENHEKIQWVICGGESVQHDGDTKPEDATPMQVGWVESLSWQCKQGGIPFFFKQWGMWSPIRTDAETLPPNYHLAPKRKGDTRYHDYYCVGKELAGAEINGELVQHFPKQRYG